MQLGMYAAAAATTVLFQSYFQNMALSGLVMMFMTLPMFLFMPFLRKIVNKFGKQEASAWTCLVSVIATVLMLVLPMPKNMTGVLIFMVLMLIYGLGIGIFMCVGNALVADAIDYQEWTTGRREDATIYALQSFFRKIAQGIGPSLGLVIMVAVGYDGALGAGQPEAVAVAMRYLVPAMYCFAAVMMFISLKFIYNIDKKTTIKMASELETIHAEKIAKQEAAAE